MTDERLAEIEARWQAATPGPWFWDSYQRVMSCAIPVDHPLNVACEDDPPCATILRLNHTGHGDEMPEPEARANARFVAEAWEDVRDLLAEARRLRSQTLPGHVARLSVFD